jgi:hypothetical protein
MREYWDEHAFNSYPLLVLKQPMIRVKTIIRQFLGEENRVQAPVHPALSLTILPSEG